jgi:Glycosyl transferase family 2
MKTALFTIAQDELDLLPLWIEHHRNCAPDTQLYVLNHDSLGDGAYYLEELRAEGVEVVPVHRDMSFDYGWLARVVQDFSAFLLNSYDVVGFCEVDELLWSPRGPLEALLAGPERFVRAAGYCVVHHHPEEPDMDWTRPILAQRHHWYPSKHYSKICFARHRVFYGVGFHAAHNVPDELPSNPDLLCVHLHQADFKTTLRRHQRNAGRFWDPRYRMSAQGVHQRLDNPGELERYLLCNLDSPTEYAQLEEIPALYKEKLLSCRPA